VDKIPGGRADNLADDEFNKKELSKGQDVEMEHTDDPELAKEITKDHMVEFNQKDENGKYNNNYYKNLDNMEKEMEKNSFINLNSLDAVIKKASSLTNAKKQYFTAVVSSFVDSTTSILEFIKVVDDKEKIVSAATDIQNMIESFTSSLTDAFLVDEDDPGVPVEPTSEF